MTFWNFTDNGDNGDGILHIDGPLVCERDWWGGDGQVVARNFRRALDRYRDVTVYINSPGGDVFAGAELYSAIREHSALGKGKITVKVTGIAASSASLVAMAGDEILMSPVAHMMIHDPWTQVVGNAREMTHAARVLEEISESLITAYHLRTGKSRETLRDMLAAETYMGAQRAVEEGFADGILYEASAPQEKPAAGMMYARSHGREAIMNRLCATPALSTEPDPALVDEAEKALRVELINRASLIADIYKTKNG